MSKINLNLLRFQSIYFLPKKVDLYNMLINLLILQRNKVSYKKIDTLNEMTRHFLYYTDNFGICSDIQEMILNDVIEWNKKRAARYIWYFYKIQCIKRFFRNVCEDFLCGRV